MLLFRFLGLKVSLRKHTSTCRNLLVANMASNEQTPVQWQRRTRVLQVNASKIGNFIHENAEQPFLGEWRIELSESSRDAAHLQEAASLLQNSDIPVAFPTETVYGLGADATRSPVVRGIYEAKQRPSDNPLIIHISSLSQLRGILSLRGPSRSPALTYEDPIPKVYHPLISKFWPGPLTLLLPLPTPSPLAPEVTTSLTTVAVRMPSSRLALALIKLAGVPLAAPSANASSRPSPTTAAHVLHDLDGRIDVILDGGACEVGVESTVVDGLSHPPVILRPGGVSIDMLRRCAGWEDVRIGYTDGAESGVPRAPGMKYKHYSPTAKVLLFHGQMDASSAKQYLQNKRRLGIVTTKTWGPNLLLARGQRPETIVTPKSRTHGPDDGLRPSKNKQATNSIREIVEAMPSSVPNTIPSARYAQCFLNDSDEQDVTEIWTMSLGPDTTDIARGLFFVLRELDTKSVDVIFVEGVDDSEGGAEAAIMNRLRKAAEAEITI